MKKDWTVTLSVKENLESLLLLLCLLKSGVVHVVHRNGQGEATVLLWTTAGWRSRLAYSSLLGMMNVIKHRPATVSSWPVL